MTVGALCREGYSKTISYLAPLEITMEGDLYNWHPLCLYDRCRCECHMVAHDGDHRTREHQHAYVSQSVVPDMPKATIPKWARNKR